MKKRQKTAVIAAIIILILVFTILVVNYVKYSNCSGVNASEKPGCAAASAEEKNATKLFPIRFNFGSRYIEIG